jgi:hypothetical protein
MDDQILVLFRSQDGFEHAINHGIDDVFHFRHGIFPFESVLDCFSKMNACSFMSINI